MASSISPSDSAISTAPEPFLFLYYSKLVGLPVLHETSEVLLGHVHDFIAQTTMPYPTVCGVEVRTATGPQLYPWSSVKGVTSQAIYLAPHLDRTVPPADYSVRCNLIRKLAVEVSATSVVRIWDIHFVYSENKMVLAHAETGIRGLLRTLRLEKLVMALLGAVLAGPLRERFATFRHLQVLRSLPDGSMPIPKRVVEMHPADLASVLRQMPGRLRRQVFNALPMETEVDVLLEAEAHLQRRLLRSCPPSRREAVQKLMSAPRDLPPL